MWPFSSKREDALITLLREQQAARSMYDAQQLDLMKTLVETVGRQHSAFEGYLKLFTGAPAPEVRVMTDAAELDSERLTRARHAAVPPLPIPEAFDPNLPSFDEILEQMRETLTGTD